MSRSRLTTTLLLGMVGMAMSEALGPIGDEGPRHTPRPKDPRNDPDKIAKAQAKRQRKAQARLNSNGAIKVPKQVAHSLAGQATWVQKYIGQGDLDSAARAYKTALQARGYEVLLVDAEYAVRKLAQVRS